jgi:hypothetical protein
MAIEVHGEDLSSPFGRGKWLRKSRYYVGFRGVA